MNRSRFVKLQTIFALGAILVASCGGGSAPEATPTQSVSQIQTFAVATFSSDLTLTALVAPTNTPAATSTPPTTIAATSTGGIPLGTPAATQAAGGDSRYFLLLWTHLCERCDHPG